MNTIGEYTDKIYALLEDDFEKLLFKAVITNLKDKDNILRVNNFSYGARELIRNILEKLAPDEEIKNCLWYTPPIGNNKITRK